MEAHYVHQSRGQNLFPSSQTHRSKRHEKGQTKIKCACEKSTHRTSQEPPLAYLTHLSNITNAHVHTQSDKVSLTQTGLNLNMSVFNIKSLPQKHRPRFDWAPQLHTWLKSWGDNNNKTDMLPQKYPVTCVQLSKFSNERIKQSMPLQLCCLILNLFRSRSGCDSDYRIYAVFENNNKGPSNSPVSSLLPSADLQDDWAAYAGNPLPKNSYLAWSFLRHWACFSDGQIKVGK